MTFIDVTANTDAEGKVHLDLPTGAPLARVRVRGTMEVADRRRASTKEEYLAFIKHVFGKGDDPTFVPPPDQALPWIEAL